MDKKLKNYVIHILRRASLRWKPRNAAFKAARVGYGEYVCSNCGQIKRRKEVQLDHVIPVIDPKEGYKNLDTYAERLLVPQEGWAVLCIECHDVKTKQEDGER
jgi:5-methylcytosine-specific restriction endonuclease McrA